jgi:hypothetical protein
MLSAICFAGMFNVSRLLDVVTGGLFPMRWPRHGQAAFLDIHTAHEVGSAIVPAN